MSTDVKLGISGSEVTLSRKIAISIPTDCGKKIDATVMSDGNTRYAFYASQRRWQLDFVWLTAAELAALVTLRGYNQSLRYQNNYESATWYTVVITSFSYDVIDPTATTVYYTASMTLEQTV
jgi:hypothetical protein